MNYKNLDEKISNLLNNQKGWVAYRNKLIKATAMGAGLPETSIEKFGNLDIFRIENNWNLFDVPTNSLPLTKKAYEVRMQEILDNI